MDFTLANCFKYLRNSVRDNERAEFEPEESALLLQAIADRDREIGCLRSDAALLARWMFGNVTESCGCWTVRDGWFTRVHHCDAHRHSLSVSGEQKK